MGSSEAAFRLCRVIRACRATRRPHWWTSTQQSSAVGASQTWRDGCTSGRWRQYTANSRRRTHTVIQQDQKHHRGTRVTRRFPHSFGFAGRRRPPKRARIALTSSSFAISAHPVVFHLHPAVQSVFLLPPLDIDNPSFLAPSHAIEPIQRQPYSRPLFRIQCPISTYSISQPPMFLSSNRSRTLMIVLASPFNPLEFWNSLLVVQPCLHTLRHRTVFIPFTLLSSFYPVFFLSHLGASNVSCTLQLIVPTRPWWAF